MDLVPVQFVIHWLKDKPIGFTVLYDSYLIYSININNVYHYQDRGQKKSIFYSSGLLEKAIHGLQLSLRSSLFCITIFFGRGNISTKLDFNCCPTPVASPLQPQEGFCSWVPNLGYVGLHFVQHYFLECGKLLFVGYILLIYFLQEKQGNNLS